MGVDPCPSQLLQTLDFFHAFPGLPFRSGDEFNCTELFIHSGPLSTKYPVFTVGSIELSNTIAKVPSTDRCTYAILAE